MASADYHEIVQRIKALESALALLRAGDAADAARVECRGLKAVLATLGYHFA